jgi:hypothetical protein
MSDRLFYDRAEAARRAGVSMDTIRRAINKGTLRAKRTGQKDDGTPTGKYLISDADLRDWFDGLVDA